ncbi:MAG: hypothetical protein H6812_13850 [Phycisphaeraceae bacterium]|nr:hypothetical protein [Phycisphaerales bacterium]MCB9844321.1 hypothetical protein [Phycisphaeraceae bacterium]
MRWSVLILSVLMIASFAGDCRAQDQPVQQGVADVDPLLESLRTYSPSLRQDNNYQHVYILDRNDPNSPFFRRAGGLYAVFPRSEYVLTSDGVVAAVPPGTVFHFGRPEPGHALPAPVERDGTLSSGRLRDSGTSDHRFINRQAATPIVTQRLDRSADAMRPNESDARSNEQLRFVEHAPGVMSDAQYRARRLAQIAARHMPRG